MSYEIPHRGDLKWLAVDLDGTLAEPTWTPVNPTRAIGEPINRNVLKLWEAVKAGYKIIIHTARPWTDYELIESWLMVYGIQFDRIICGKLLALAYIDDKAIHEGDDSWIPSWGPVSNPSKAEFGYKYGELGYADQAGD
jgi:hypothetical protein